MDDTEARKVGPAAGNRGKGRPKGTPNKSTKALKDAILLAAEQHGENDAGKDGLTGYLRLLARSEPRAFASLLGRVLPLTVNGTVGLTVNLESDADRL